MKKGDTKKHLIVLGHNGMLGRMVCRYFKDTTTLETRFDPKSPQTFIDHVQNACKEDAINYIINCIGVIPQKKPSEMDFFAVNTMLPILLACSLKNNQYLINPGTDCIQENNKTATTAYGSSKLASMLALEKYPRCISTLCSIVGPDSDYGLMGWLLSQDKYANIQGYTNHYWNGITTLYWCQLVEEHILNQQGLHLHKIYRFGSDTISKYMMLELFALTFQRTDLKIDARETRETIYRLVEDLYVKKSFSKQLEELKTFMNKN